MERNSSCQIAETVKMSRVQRLILAFEGQADYHEQMSEGIHDQELPTKSMHKVRRQSDICFSVLYKSSSLQNHGDG